VTDGIAGVEEGWREWVGAIRAGGDCLLGGEHRPGDVRIESLVQGNSSGTIIVELLSEIVESIDSSRDISGDVFIDE
jgi:hypothetical protein